MSKTIPPRGNQVLSIPVKSREAPVFICALLQAAAKFPAIAAEFLTIPLSFHLFTVS